MGAAYAAVTNRSVRVEEVGGRLKYSWDEPEKVWRVGVLPRDPTQEQQITAARPQVAKWAEEASQRPGVEYAWISRPARKEGYVDVWLWHSGYLNRREKHKHAAWFPEDARDQE
ncbi:hypothetical protein HNP84_005922 [Thermocatellispora tengchongensis]|uniref:Uncharacterized protein n=1 Tax=Thermocatellispora tengchongensis TaxID=1073253 RepID=A0A840P933_9ACTN|nr:hypothetical protein [Thermocatellispora tengchongensis]MBB5136178.1 hypothetical protein [Thermocatellispora tengchongensis]